MILFFYNLALLAALVVGAPWWLWQMATTQKYREGSCNAWDAFEPWKARATAR